MQEIMEILGLSAEPLDDSLTTTQLNYGELERGTLPLMRNENSR
jgi:hypothetical protein